MMRSFFSLFLILIVFVFVFFNCEKEAVNNLNIPPVITKLVVIPQEVIPGGTSTLTVFATDENNDPISFRWTSTAGSITQLSTNSIMWTAPNSVGDYTLTVTAQDGEAMDTMTTTIHVVEIFGKLTVNSNPDQADIIIDDQNTGQQTSHTFDNILIGEHVIKVFKQGFMAQPDSMVVNIQENDSIEVSFTLSQNFGQLKVTSNPDQADIILDNQNTGQKTPYTFPQVAEGQHIVKVVKSGFVSTPDSAIVNVIKNQTVEINFMLSQTVGALQVTSNPSDADIILDGLITGQKTPYIFDQVTVGDHIIKINKQGYIPDQDSLVVTVTPDDTVNANFTMYEAAAVQGFVLYENTTIPIPDVTVWVINSYDTTDNNGSYFVGGIAPGTHTLIAGKPDYDIFNLNLNFTSGQVLDQNIEMTSSVFTHLISGQITNGASQPVESALVTLLNPDDSPSNLSGLSDMNGNYQIPTVPEGDRRLKIQQQYYEDKTIDILVSGSSTIFDIQLIAHPIDPPMNLSILGDWNIISLDWDMVSSPAIAGYNIYRSRDEFSGYKRVNANIIVTNFYEDVIDTLTIPSTYYYKVASVNVDGIEGNLSDPVQYTTPTLLSGTVNWNGIFKLLEDFTIGVGNTLNIESGSQILLKSSRRIFVQGELHAMGIQSQIIKFLPFDGPDLEIKFISGSTGGSFDYCVFEGKGIFDVNIASPDSVEIMNSMFLPLAPDSEAVTINVIQGGLNISNCILNSVKSMNIADYLNMQNSAIFNSQSGINGGSNSMEKILVRNNLFVSNGRSIRLPDTEAEANIDHNVIVNNPGSYPLQSGMGIEYETETPETYQWDVTNNIIIKNRFGIYNNGSQTNSHSVQDYNDVWNNTIANYGGNYINPGPNSISADPLFMSPDYMNPMNGNWNLQIGSPCSGTGMNATDIGLIDPNNIGPQ